MMKLKNGPLFDLDGSVIMERDERDQVQPGAKPTTIARCLQLILLQPAPQGQAYSPEQSTERLLAAITCHKVADTATFEIKDDLANALRFDATRTFAPIIAGQLAILLKGGKQPITAKTAEA